MRIYKAKQLYVAEVGICRLLVRKIWRSLGPIHLGFFAPSAIFVRKWCKGTSWAEPCKCYSKCYLTSYSLSLASTFIYIIKFVLIMKIQFTFKRNQWSCFSNISFKTDTIKMKSSRISLILCLPPTFFFFTFINEEVL